MRVGGTREIIVSAHLAYGEAGIPGRIPSNALLRCLVELVEIRQHYALLPQDWLPGKSLLISSPEGANATLPSWQLSIHESGTAWLSFIRPTLDNHQNQSWRQLPIELEAAKSAKLIREAIDLPNHMTGDCVTWNSGFIDKKHCMVIQVMESGTTVLMIGILNESSAFQNSAFSRALVQLTGPYLSADQAST
jgi:hypothetical protein